MSALPTFHPAIGVFRSILACLTIFTFTAALPLSADDEKKAEDAVLKLAANHEPDGFDFRADIWVRELAPSVGKAVRVQLFKGNDYRICVAVPMKSGVEITASVLDGSGKPIEAVTELTDKSWGVILHVKPSRTGIYVVTIRRAGGTEKSTQAAMITGYK